jgi:hypothetical protein
MRRSRLFQREFAALFSWNKVPGRGRASACANPQVIDLRGKRGGNRTYNLVIKSPQKRLFQGCSPLLASALNASFTRV